MNGNSYQSKIVNFKIYFFLQLRAIRIIDFCIKIHNTNSLRGGHDAKSVVFRKSLQSVHILAIENNLFKQLL